MYKKIDDTYIALGGTDKSVYIYDFSKDSVNDEEFAKLQIARMEENKDILTALEFTPDKRLISASADKTIRKWNVDTGKELFCYKNDQPLSCIKK